MNPRQRDGGVPRETAAVRLVVRDHRKLATLAAIVGLSTRDLARVAGWQSNSYAGRLLRGEVVGVRPEPALLIAEALGVDLDELFVTVVSTNAGQLVGERVA